MNDFIVLTRYSLRKVRGPAIALGILLFGLQILMAAVARTFEISGQFSEMARFIPEFIRPMLDPSFMAALSFSGMVCFGYTHVIVILLLTAQSIAAGTELVGEIESKFADLLVARPIRRSSIVVRSAGTVVLLTFGSVASMLVGSFAGLTLLAPSGADRPTVAAITSLALNLSLLAIAWGGVALAISAFARRRAVAASATGLVAFAMFIIDFTGRLWEPVDKLAVLSPFRYYTPFPMIAGEHLSRVHVAVLTGIFVAGTAVALLAYQKRDL